MKWDESFLEVCESLFRIKATSSSGTYTGAGFVIAKYHTSEKLGFVLATARHLFNKLPNYENIQWKIEKYDCRGNKTYEMIFKSNTEVTGGSPMRMRTDADIGALFVPRLDLQEIKPLRIIPSVFAVQPGARVGWAGFPKITKVRTETPYPCYFEGVISAVIEKEESEHGKEVKKLFYLVDGHGGEGVSGGPLWYWNDKKKNYEIIGICSGYIFGDPISTPGLVVFESVNPLVAYLSATEELELNIVS